MLRGSRITEPASQPDTYKFAPSIDRDPFAGSGLIPLGSDHREQQYHDPFKVRQAETPAEKRAETIKEKVADEAEYNPWAVYRTDQPKEEEYDPFVNLRADETPNDAAVNK